MRENSIYCCDCMEFMKDIPSKTIPFILTDIPYNEVERKTNGLSQMKSLDTLGPADKATFNTLKFCEEIYRICNNSLVVFCGREQFSEVFNFFANKSGTTRPIVWEKTNPVPSNGQYVYLSGVEFAVWFKKKGAKTFNAHCKNTVFRYPIPGGKKRIHPTQKHWDMFKELILDNTNEGDLVFDPCAGGMTTMLAAAETNRKFICLEKDKETYDKSVSWHRKNTNIDFKEAEYNGTI